MNILIVGSGAREHSIAVSVQKSPLCSRLFCLPGNAGIAEIAECFPIAINDCEGIVSFCKEQGVEFVIIGPELPLSLGLADSLSEAGIKVFGPSKAAAELESSKIFMKSVCSLAGLPTAKYRDFDDYNEATQYVLQEMASMPEAIVVKADGLASGKGVTVARSAYEAVTALKEAMVDKIFGESGSKVIIEEFLSGEEASVFALCDGKTARFFASAQDHKAVHDGDTGPNTGGMGAYSPAPVIDEAMLEQIMEEIINPTVKQMNKLGKPFCGVLFAGLMITKDGPKLMEFNARFGDPETEAILPRLTSDLLELLLACSEGRLEEAPILFSEKPALCVVVASNGYPGEYAKGVAINNLDKVKGLPDTMLFHAGTKLSESGEIVSNGGRVLCISAIADDLKKAQKQAYNAVDAINWHGGFCRRDIGWRAVK
ncbi:MAG: phosphoribosylamine--glycine ligase [Alphaproteobacteria bacterium]|nr:phosphoribosylamine--glycine ligase [Alphaproteobacteria bacterium]MCL2505780.1 phosphoribosylamine--glycine ligase [Alphaproteobacteria bacterium]